MRSWLRIAHREGCRNGGATRPSCQSEPPWRTALFRIAHFESCGDAKMALFDFVEVFYNQQRRHSTLGQISPAAFERSTLEAQAA
ncbi:MAG: IS3 family transposase [Acidobacteriota bacterium]|nr:IS3 family transposase [Acidobacteriota bacterium]